MVSPGYFCLSESFSLSSLNSIFSNGLSHEGLGGVESSPLSSAIGSAPILSGNFSVSIIKTKTRFRNQLNREVRQKPKNVFPLVNEVSGKNIVSKIWAII